MAAAVILVGVIVVAMGRGGEMAEFTADVRPVDTDIETATDEALNLVARTVTERDVEIATLRRQIADMQSAREPGAAAQPGQGGPGSPASPFLRRQASPAEPPPAEKQPWSAWDRLGPASPPGQGEPAEPEETR